MNAPLNLEEEAHQPVEMLRTAMYLYQKLVESKFPDLSAEVKETLTGLLLPLIGYEIGNSLQRLVPHAGNIILATEMALAEDASK